MKENFFYDLYHNAPVAYQSLNEEGFILEVNSFWLDLLGYSGEEVKGKWFGDFLAEASRSTFKTNFSKFKKHGYINNVKFDMLAKDGSLVSVIFEGKVSYNDDGDFNMTHCVFLRSGEKPVKAPDVFHQSAFEQINIPMLVIDPVLLTVLDVNQAVCELFGGCYRDIVNKHIIELTLEGLEKIEMFQEQIKGGNISPFESTIVDFNNSIKTIEIYPSAFEIAEKRYVYLVLVDITDEKNQAEKLLIKDKISNAFLNHDESEIFAGISKILRNTFAAEFCYVGYIRTDGALVSSSMTIEVWDKCQMVDKQFVFERESWSGMWGKSLVERRSFFQNEELHVPVGHVKLDNAMAVIIEDDNKLLGQFVVANKKNGFCESDLNMGLLIADTVKPILKFWLENRESQELLNEKKEELRIQLVKEMDINKKQEQILFEQKKFVDMGQMMSAIAHQWRQPLNNIHLIMHSIKQLRSGIDTGFTFEQLETMHRDAVDFMSRTIDNFRDYLSRSSGEEVFSVIDAILDTINLISAQFLSQDIKIIMECCGQEFILGYETKDELNEYESTNMQIKGDVSSFHQVILNLLSNARDALLEYRAEQNNFAGGINISVRPMKDTLQISVFNNGFHISEEIMPKIFDPYFTTKEDGKGTGVGLYMTKMIVEDAYKGTINALNQDGGVQFIINLPRVV